jgi:hypothetical protein
MSSKGSICSQLTLERDLGDTGTVGLDVTQVTDVAGLSGPVTVLGTERVEVRSSGGASVGVVTELAVKAMQEFDL